MLYHIVLLAPRPDLKRAERDRFVAAFEHAVREVATVRSVRVGQMIAGPQYGDAAGDRFPYAAILEFDDAAGLQTYLDHPAHAELGVLFRGSMAAALVGDYDMSGIEALGDWSDI